MVVIQLKQLHFGYDRQSLFANMNLSIPAGGIYGLLGKNGVGKTTLLKLMAGLRYAQSGDCHVLGKPTARRPVSLLADLFYLPEEFGVPDVTAVQYQRLYAPFYPRFDTAGFEEMMDGFELNRGTALRKFSFGQKKKFILSFGLATGCRLMLLDEPTNGLDIPSKGQFRKALVSAFSEDRLIIISTHQARDLESIIDAVVILHGGKIIFNQTIQNVQEHLCICFEKHQPDSQKALHVETIPGGYAVVYPNEDQDDTEVDLEILFQTVMSDPLRMADVFDDRLA
jgi:ABC-2 type transport system ATP-binding protein